MPTFIWKAKDRYGQEVAQRISADSAQSAKEILVSEGYTDLRLQQDEIVEMAKKQSEAASDPEYAPKLTAQQEAEQFDGKFPTFWSNWWNDIKGSSFTIIMWLGLMLWGLYQNETWVQILSAVFLFGLVFLFPIFSFWFGRTSRLYHKLMKAKIWHRWPEVYALSYRLEKVQSRIKISVGPCETARLRAEALAGMGRLPEAIKEFESFSDPSKLEPALYYCYLACIYGVARDFDASLSLKIKAAEAMPQNTAFWIDVAFHYLLRNEDLEKGREALARVDESLVVEQIKPWLKLIRGLILLIERNPAAAREEFEAARKGLEPYLHNVLVESALYLSKSYLCLACALAGDRDKAVDLWHEVAPYLEAIKEKELLAKIRAALGDCA